MQFHFLSHFNHRPAGAIIDTLIVHSMYAPGAQDPLDALECINTLDLNKVSAHYLIDRKGQVFQLVNEQERAWHAGQSKLPYDFDARENVNNFSIGVELIATGQGSFEDSQYSELVNLINDILTRQPLRYILGHQQIAPNRKQDPGSGFDWQKLRDLIQASSNIKNHAQLLIG